MNGTRLSALFLLLFCLGSLGQAEAQSPAPRRNLLTPGTMLARGFSFGVRCTDETIKVGAQPTARTGVVLVQVNFDEEMGPQVKEVGTAYLEIREGESLLAFVPMEASKRPQTGNLSRLQFSARDDLLMKMSIVLMPRGQGNSLGYAIPIKEFYQAAKVPPARSNNGMQRTRTSANLLSSRFSARR